MAGMAAYLEPLDLMRCGSRFKRSRSRVSKRVVLSGQICNAMEEAPRNLNFGMVALEMAVEPLSSDRLTFSALCRSRRNAQHLRHFTADRRRAFSYGDSRGA